MKITWREEVCRGIRHEQTIVSTSRCESRVADIMIRNVASLLSGSGIRIWLARGMPGQDET